MANYLTEMNAVFLALADETRRSVIDRLASDPASVSELAEPFDMAPEALNSVERWIAERRMLGVRNQIGTSK